MIKKIFHALFCCCIPFMLHAQQAGKKKAAGCGCSFSSINQVGLLEGSSRSAFQAQTINGIRYKTWFAGLGIGLDHYYIRTIPFFFDVRKDLFNKKSTPFLYGDIGIQFPWTKFGDRVGRGVSDVNRGLYYDAGIGYKLGFGKNKGILFSGGFSLKRIRETRSIGAMCITAPCPDFLEVYDYSLRRFSLKAGLQL